MGNFSSPPADELIAALEKGYTRVHIEQGVPLLDRDLNLLGDLSLARMRELVTSTQGDFAQTSESFRVVSLPASELPSSNYASDFEILPGICITGGTVARNTEATRYSEQDLPAISEPTSSRLDLVYLDVFETEVNDAQDPALANPDDVGSRTSVRTRTTWRVRVVEGWDEAPLSAPSGHHYFELATFQQTPAGPPRDPTDLRRLAPRLRLNERFASIEARLERIEQRLGQSLLPATDSVQQLDEAEPTWTIPLSATSNRVLILGKAEGGTASDRRVHQVLAIAARSDSSITQHGSRFYFDSTNPDATAGALFVLLSGSESDPGDTEFARLAVDAWEDDAIRLRLSRSTDPTPPHPLAHLRVLAL